MSKKSFLLYKQDIFLLDALSNKQLGELFSMILRWQNGDESVRSGIKSDDAMVYGFFRMFAKRFEAEEKEYQRVCDVRRENGRRGGVASASKSKQMLAKDSKLSKSNPILSFPYNNSDNRDNIEIEVIPTDKEKGKSDVVVEPRVREDWRHLSSVRKDMLGWDRDEIAEFKKSLLREEVEALGILTPEGVDAFVLKWGEHNPGTDTIRAEMEPVFNVQERAKNYARIGRRPDEEEKPAGPDRFEDGKTYWLKDFTKEDLMGLDFDVRRHVLRRGAVKRMNGKWIID